MKNSGSFKHPLGTTCEALDLTVAATQRWDHRQHRGADAFRSWVHGPAGLSVLQREMALLRSTIGQHRLNRPWWVWAHRSALQLRR